jgi:phenylacetic acid degradation operon negative regulatory protein
VSVPEQRRAFRDELRRAAHLAGYATLRPGLLVAASDRRAELDDLLTRIPPGASVVAGRLELGLGESRRVANELWDLEDLGHRFRSLAAFSRAAAKSALGGSLTGSQAFGAFAAATLPIYTAVADDPGLPAELLPAHWPAPELGAALGEALQAFGPPVTAHIADLRSIAQRRIPSTALR